MRLSFYTEPVYKMTHQARNKPKIVIYSLEQESHACAIIRILGPMRLKNWEIVWAVKFQQSGFLFDVEVAHQADLIVILRNFPSPCTEKALQSIVRLNVPIIYDLDDALLDVPEAHPFYKWLSTSVPYIKWILKEADLITVSTKVLKESLTKYTSRPIVVQPNVVDWNLFNALPRPQKKHFNFLISGTSTHLGDWSLIEEPLAEILNTYQKRVNAIFFGEIPKRFSNHPSAQLVPFQTDYKSYAAILKGLDIQAALVPLENTRFNNCKSNIKWLEYSASGITGVFSNLTPYSSCIRNGETGLLVNDSENDWFQGMKQLVENPASATLMIENARCEVREHYSIESMSDKYLAVFNDLFGTKHVHSIFSDFPILPEKINARIHQIIDRHIMWRFNRKN